VGAGALGALSVVELVCHDEVVSAAHPSLLAYHNTGLFSDSNEAQTEHVFELSPAERALVDAEYESPTGASG